MYNPVQHSQRPRLEGKELRSKIQDPTTNQVTLTQVTCKLKPSEA